MTDESVKAIRQLLAAKIGEAENKQDKDAVKRFMRALKEFNELMIDKNAY